MIAPKLMRKKRNVDRLKQPLEERLRRGMRRVLPGRFAQIFRSNVRRHRPPPDPHELALRRIPSFAAMAAKLTRMRLKTPLAGL
jgi:hypothetical protein